MKSLAIELDNGDDVATNDFLNRYCVKFTCAKRRFEKRVFLNCVYPEGLGIARFISLLNPGFFRSDFELIEEIKYATSYSEVKKLVDFHGTQNAPAGVLRMLLKVRLSKQRLLALAQSVFPDRA